MRALFLVPKLGWSHENAARELMKHYPHVQADYLTMPPETLQEYEVIFCYTYADTETRDKLRPYKERVVIVFSSGHPSDPALDMVFQGLSREFGMFGYVSLPLYLNFVSKYPQLRHYYLTHGITVEKFTPPLQEKRPFTVGWVGDPRNPDKRFALAVTSAKAAGVQFKVASDLKYEDMPAFYKSIDVLLSTSIAEAHPMAVYEAMACGLPVICTGAGDVTSEIIQYVNGIYINEHATETDIGLLLTYLKDHSAYAKLVGKAARMTIMQRWTWDIIAPTYSMFFPQPPQEDVSALNVEGKLNLRVKGITWGGAFFLDLITPDFKKSFGYETVTCFSYRLPPATVDALDILYVVSPRTGKEDLFEDVMNSGKHVIWHWIGSDVMDLHETFNQAGKLPEMYTKNAHLQHHLAVSQNLVEELASIGIEAKQMNMITNWTFPLAPLPEKFTILVYYPPVGGGKFGNLYGQDVVKRIIAKRPEYQFILYGLRKGQVLDVEAPNVKGIPWVEGKDEMDAIYRAGSCLLRYNLHDGYPSSMIEAVMMGRQVVTNGKFPYTIYVDTEEKALKALDRIKDSKIQNVRGSAYYRANQVKEVFLREFKMYLLKVMGKG